MLSNEGKEVIEATDSLREKCDTLCVALVEGGSPTIFLGERDCLEISGRCQCAREQCRIIREFGDRHPAGHQATHQGARSAGLSSSRTRDSNPSESASAIAVRFVALSSQLA